MGNGKRAALLWLLLSFTTALPTKASEPFQDALLREHLWRQVRALPRAERPTVGLALSAGGFRGVAHLGVIQTLEYAGFPIDVVAGTSMGAVLGSLYASGMPFSKILAMRKNLNLGTGTNFNALRFIRLLLSDSLLSTEKIEHFITNTIGNKTFDQLSKPFACVAMDIKTGEPIIFWEGPVAPAVRASMTLPGLFSPVEYRHRYLVDGGVVDYVPLDAAKLLGAQWVLSSITEGDYTKSNTTSVLMALQQVIDIRGSILAHEQLREANIVVEPDVGDILFYESWRTDEALRKGRVAMRAKLQAAEESLILFALPQLWTHWTSRAKVEPR